MYLSAFLIILVSFFSQTQAGEFSFYIFACEWAGTDCELENCNQDKGSSTEFWNIHGLWPSDGQQGLNFCTEEKFNYQEIISLQPDLVKYWNGLYSSAQAFHSHEWSKHGTCSNMTQKDFFSAVLTFAKTIDVYGALEKDGIIPGSSYSCSQVAQALQKELNVKSFSVQEDDGYLRAIQVCVDTDLHLQDCPKGISDDICEGTVRYPTYSLKNI